VRATTASRSPIHRADAGHRVVVADAVGQQALADFPREHRHVLRLVADDRVDHLARCHLRLAASDDARLDRACVVKSTVATSIVSGTSRSQQTIAHRTQHLRLIDKSDGALNENDGVTLTKINSKNPCTQYT